MFMRNAAMILIESVGWEKLDKLLAAKHRYEAKKLLAADGVELSDELYEQAVEAWQAFQGLNLNIVVNGHAYNLVMAKRYAPELLSMPTVPGQPPPFMRWQKHKDAEIEVRVAAYDQPWMKR